jgi:ectoine hydroxylase-related dioxygenase (phytanoyl-CoA dioxygenase family)
MAALTMESIADQVREITDDEVQQYREQGWVELKGLVSKELAGEMLDHLKQVTGIEYDELPKDHPEAQNTMDRVREAGLGLFQMSRMEDQTVWDIVTSKKLGEASARLSGHRPMRLFTDGVICKMPKWTEGMGGLMGGATPWHQDMPPMPMDRPGGVQFWLALCEITPEMGSMQHLTGSHVEPPIGNIQYTKDQTLETERPDILEKYEMSPAHHFQPGDVLAHHPLTLHYAQENTTDKLRWVYTSYRIPSNTLYNGIPNARIDEYGFKPWQPHDHPKFPIVTEED